METIAFSAKSLDWKTRYSFTPLAYAKSNNKFVSFTKPNSSFAETSGVHLHDSSQQYNTFYGANYKSSMSVVTNNDPSATKIFEAFSVEGSKGDWSAEFRTNTGEEQYSSFPANTMIEKEGKHYIDIPKNVLNKDMMLSYVGSTTLLDIANALSTEISPNKIKLRSKIQAVPGRALAFSMSQLPEEYFEGIPGYSSSNFPQGTYRYHFGGGVTNFETEENPNPQFSAALSKWGYDPYTNSITHDAIYADTGEDFDVQEIIEQGALQYGFFPLFLLQSLSNNAYAGTFSPPELANIPITIYSISYVEQDGEDMRGEYMNVSLERSGSDYYEVYALNVDQHKTKLDHSLGQNN